MFNEAIGTKDEENDENGFLMLKIKVEKKSQQFQFWSLTLKMVLDYLISSISLANFR